MSAILRYFSGGLCPACGEDAAIVEENADLSAVHLECIGCGEQCELDPASYRVGKYVGQLDANPPDDHQDDDEPVPPPPLRVVPA